MSGALSRHTPHDPPQREPILGRENDMVKNAAGGYTFRKDVWTQLADFLVLGTEGGTYYADERKHTYRNIGVVTQAVREDGHRAVTMAVEYSTGRPPRVPKPYPALYVVAYALAAGDLETKRAAAIAVPKVARTTDHLAHLFGYWKQFSSKPSGRGGVGRGPVGANSRAVRRAWVNWFTARPAEDVAYTLLKGRSRKTGDGEDFRPGHLLSLCRPVPDNEVQQALFALATERKTPMEVSGFFAAAKAFYEAQRVTTPAEAVKVINAYHVPWEFLPDSVLKDPKVWRALIPHLGMTALIRNLARMTGLGVFAPFHDATNQVVNRLTDRTQLHRGRIHPFDVLLARLTYGSGYAQPNPNAPARTWTPDGRIVDALDRAYTLATGVCDKSPGRLVVAVDCSGSMSYPVRHGGSTLGSCYHLGTAIAATLMRTFDGDCYPIEFAGDVKTSQLRAGMSLSEIYSLRHSGGATDCSGPIQWALANNVECDAFVLITDNETWSGHRHVSRVLEDYRRRVNPAARVIVLSMTAAWHSVGDPRDPGVLNVAGFDSAIPTLISGFMRAGVV